MNDRWRYDESRRWADPGPWDQPEPRGARGRGYGPDDGGRGGGGWRGGGRGDEDRSFRPAAWPHEDEQRAWRRYAGGWRGDQGRGDHDRAWGRDWRGGDRSGGYGGYGYGPEPDRERDYTGFSAYGADRTPDDYGAGRPERGGWGTSGGPGYGGGREGSGSGGRDWWDKTRDEVASWFGDERAERRRDWDHRRGEHHGRGPKGYVRSDERIREDINDRLTYDGWLDASNIDVVVDGAEVTLTGTVSSREDKRRAEDLADSIHGVKHVQNNLRIDSGGTSEATTATTGPTAGGSRTGRVM